MPSMIKTNPPKIDVYIPVYNDREFISRAINSCLNQTGVDVRVVVSDNCSSDGTYEIVKTLAQDDARIVLHRNDENLGLAGNIQKLHERIDRAFYMFLCSDDYLQDISAFAHALQLFDKYPDMVSVYSNIDFVDASGRRIIENAFSRGEVFNAEQTLRQSLIETRNRFGIPLLHRTALSAQYKYRTDLPYSGDLWHSYKVGKHGECGHINRACIANTYTGQNLTVSLMRDAMSELRLIEEGEGIKLGLLERCLQYFNHVKTIIAKAVFFKILIPFRAKFKRS